MGKESQGISKTFLNGMKLDICLEDSIPMASIQGKWHKIISKNATIYGEGYHHPKNMHGHDTEVLNIEKGPLTYKANRKSWLHM